MLFFLFISLLPFFFVAPVLLFHSSTHTHLKTHTKTKERKKKQNLKRIKRAQKPQIKTQDKKT
jgi:hypothetical protein